AQGRGDVRALDALRHELLREHLDERLAEPSIDRRRGARQLDANALASRVADEEEHAERDESDESQMQMHARERSAKSSKAPVVSGKSATVSHVEGRMSAKEKIRGLTTAWYGFALFVGLANLAMNGVGIFSLVGAAIATLFGITMSWIIGRFLLARSSFV